ncbi:hypothetical protein Tco_1578103 [Tanacetum coccineum]
MSDSSGGGLSDLDDIDDLEMIMQQVQSEQEQEEAAERVRRRNYIYRQRLDAEEHTCINMVQERSQETRYGPRDGLGHGSKSKDKAWLEFMRAW